MQSICKIVVAATLALLTYGIAAKEVIEPRVLDVKELLEVIEVIDVTAEKEIDESSEEALDPEVDAILDEAVREEIEPSAEEE